MDPLLLKQKQEKSSEPQFLSTPAICRSLKEQQGFRIPNLEFLKICQLQNPMIIWWLNKSKVKTVYKTITKYKCHFLVEEKILIVPHDILVS